MDDADEKIQISVNNSYVTKQVFHDIWIEISIPHIYKLCLKILNFLLIVEILDEAGKY